jgi:hypothetical protein
MKAVTWMLIAGVLVFASGCASTDWIDRTLVTEDVTGTWEGSTTAITLRLDLKQEGTRVKGTMRAGGGDIRWNREGPIEGTLAGDLFSFKQTVQFQANQWAARGSVDRQWKRDGWSGMGDRWWSLPPLFDSSWLAAAVITFERTGARYAPRYSEG